jgi:hypothetical protein
LKLSEVYICLLGVHAMMAVASCFTMAKEGKSSRSSSDLSLQYIIIVRSPLHLRSTALRCGSKKKKNKNILAADQTFGPAVFHAYAN